MARQAKSKKHSNTVAKIYRLFRTMMDTAVDDGLLRVNPVHIKGAAVERSVERPEVATGESCQLTEAEPGGGADPDQRAEPGVEGGADALHVVPVEVDLDERTLRVEQALMFIRDKGPTLGPPKSAAAHRTVTIPVSAAQILAGHIDSYADEGPDAFVFTSIKGSPLLNRYFTPYWKRALKEAGLPETTRFHDLRHLAGTSAATAGASLREVMARMGHASADASLRYLKASERRDGEIADAIEKRMDLDLKR